MGGVVLVRETDPGSMPPPRWSLRPVAIWNVPKIFSSWMSRPETGSNCVPNPSSPSSPVAGIRDAVFRGGRRPMVIVSAQERHVHLTRPALHRHQSRVCRPRSFIGNWPSAPRSARNKPRPAGKIGHVRAAPAKAVALSAPPGRRVPSGAGRSGHRQYPKSISTAVRSRQA